MRAMISLALLASLCVSCGSDDPAPAPGHARGPGSCNAGDKCIDPLGGPSVTDAQTLNLKDLQSELGPYASTFSDVRAGDRFTEEGTYNVRSCLFTFVAHVLVADVQHGHATLEEDRTISSGNPACAAGPETVSTVTKRALLAPVRALALLGVKENLVIKKGMFLGKTHFQYEYDRTVEGQLTKVKHIVDPELPQTHNVVYESEMAVINGQVQRVEMRRTGGGP